MGILKKLLKAVLFTVLFIALAFAGLLLYSTLTDFQPEEKIAIESVGNHQNAIADSATLTFAIWNIGYCGLGAEIDFFYDGGTVVHTPEKLVDKYKTAINNELKTYYDFDFVLLQEVDQDSKRSGNFNQSEYISKVLPFHNYATAINYDVDFIPIPFTNPFGKVLSGLTSYSKYQSTENTRYQFPGNYSWPNRIYFLDRCFLLQRFSTTNGKELVVINTHNSAYDDGGLKKQQMEYLKTILLEEYDKGNYVVVGGDWNQTPPDFDNNKFVKEGGEQEYDQIPIEADFMPLGWQWVYDSKRATNRKLTYPYDENKTFTTVIDFFLTSPNVNVFAVQGKDLNFQSSDHQPVIMMVSLK